MTDVAFKLLPTHFIEFNHTLNKGSYVNEEVVVEATYLYFPKESDNVHTASSDWDTEEHFTIEDCQAFTSKGVDVSHLVDDKDIIRAIKIYQMCEE
jgi:hypothetical protein